MPRWGSGRVRQGHQLGAEGVANLGETDNSSNNTHNHNDIDSNDSNIPNRHNDNSTDNDDTNISGSHVFVRQPMATKQLKQHKQPQTSKTNKTDVGLHCLRILPYMCMYIYIYIYIYT